MLSSRTNCELHYWHILHTLAGFSTGSSSSICMAEAWLHKAPPPLTLTASQKCFSFLWDTAKRFSLFLLVRRGIIQIWLIRRRSQNLSTLAGFQYADFVGCNDDETFDSAVNDLVSQRKWSSSEPVSSNFTRGSCSGFPRGNLRRGGHTLIGHPKGQTLASFSFLPVELR